MTAHLSVKKLTVVQLIAVFVYLLSPFILARQTYAVELTEGYLRLDRMKAAEVTGGTVCMKPSTTHTSTLDEVAVTFPAGYTVGVVASTNWDGSATGIPSGSTAMPGIAAATAVKSSQTITWTFASDQTVTGGTLYCFTFGNSATLTVATAGNDQVGTLTMTDSTPANSESTTIALSSVTNDQVTVDADVPATFTFTLPDTALDHGTLSSGAVDTDAQSSGMSITTNAENGWMAWLKGDSTDGVGLYSASTTDSIATTNGTALETAVAGTDDWLVDVTTAGNTGSHTIATEFDGNSSTTGGSVSSGFELIASSSTVSSADTVTLTSIVAIDATQKAANDYTETLTVVASGNF